MKLMRLALPAALAAAVTTAALAHHSNAQFDRTKVVKLEGTVADYQWTNPHIWVELIVPGANGAAQKYSIEGPSPSILRQRGWKFNSLKPGDKAVVSMHPLRTGQPGGGLMAVTANGQTLTYEGPETGGAGAK